MTLRERVRVTVTDRERVTETVRDTLTVAVRVPILDGAWVAAPLRERVIVTLLLRVSEVVPDRVANCDAGTVMVVRACGASAAGVVIDASPGATAGHGHQERGRGRGTPTDRHWRRC